MARGRRGYGEGSVHKDRRSGLWVATVELPPDGTGRRRRRSFRATTEREVRRRLREAQTSLDQGLPVGDAASTGEWLNHWAAHVLPHSGVEPVTVDYYRSVIRVRIVPYLGAVPLRRLEVEHVEAMIAGLTARGRSAATIALARTVLRRALADAERRGKVSRNVASLARAPRKAPARIDDALDAESVARVLETLRGDRLEALGVLNLATGLRISEQLGLAWGDVDLVDGTVTVRRSKTPAGLRTIAIPAIAVEALRRHHVRQLEDRVAAPVWEHGDYVFADQVGRRLDRRQVWAWWQQVTTRAGVGRRRFHANRHTAATLMLNNGVPLEVVSATLGHAGLAITADVYAKVRPGLQRTAADAMQTVLEGARR